MDLIVTQIILLGVVCYSSADGNGNLTEMITVFQGNFQSMDPDSDGKVSYHEFTATFLKDDRNGDGQVTLQEYIQDEPLDENKNVLAEEFSFYDVNGDSILSDHDFQQTFQTIDSNGDGDIVQSEFVAYATHEISLL